MSSSLKPVSVPVANLGITPAGEWQVVPGLETETILRTPRMDPAGELPVPASPTPSFWKNLFPAASDAPAVERTTDPAHGQILGHFIIERRIGSGAMGAVFLAYDERLNRQVALKVLAPSHAADPSTVQRFQNEAQAAARLDHDHVARVFYYGEERGLHFIAYEYVAGINLRDLLRQRGRLSPAETVNYAIQIATALRHTSRNGVIHRDIKPSNIIVSPGGRAKLVDLGLARQDGGEAGGDLTVAGTTLGTFDYISPEQARDPRTVDVRSDIYSLGCTLYHLLTGVPPYPEGTVLQKLLDHQAHETPDVAAKNRRVPPAFSAVIRKMMSSDVKRRYATPEELLRDLTVIARGLGLRVVSSEATLFVPESRLKGTWWDRNFGWVLTSAALILLVATLQAVPDLLERLTRLSSQVRPVTSPPEPGKSVEPVLHESSPPTVSQTPAEVPRIPRPLPMEAGQPLMSETDPAESTASTDTPDEEAVTPAVIPAPAAKPEPEPVTAAVPGDESLPRISLVGGKAAFASLEQACAEARDGDIIELRFDGLQTVPEHQIRVSNKRLVLRAANGFRPRLEFTDSGRPGDSSATRVITLSGGSLQLVHIDLVAHVGASVTSAPWTLFALERPEQLKLDGVTITIVNPKRRPASVLELGTSGGTASSGMMKTGQPQLPPVVQISGCVVRGTSSLLTVRDPVPARCSVEDSLIALDESLLQIFARPSVNSPANDRLRLELTHTSTLLGGSLILARSEENLNDAQLPVFVVAQNNLISVGREQPMIDLAGSDAMEVRESFAWSGERNFYNEIKSFWTIRARQNSTPATFDFTAWKEFWGSEISGSANGPIRWEGNFTDLRMQDVTLNAVTLMSTGSPNPAIKAAADGTDLGAPLDKLPSPPLVETAN